MLPSIRNLNIQQRTHHWEWRESLVWIMLSMFFPCTNGEMSSGDTCDVSLIKRRKGGLSTIKVSIEIVFLWWDLRLDKEDLQAHSSGLWGGVDIARRLNKSGLPKIKGLWISDTFGRVPLIINVPWSAAAKTFRGPLSEVNLQNAVTGKERGDPIFRH